MDRVVVDAVSENLIDEAFYALRPAIKETGSATCQVGTVSRIFYRTVAGRGKGLQAMVKYRGDAQRR